MSKRFHITDVLTVISGKMLSTRNIDGVWDIVKYMSGNDGLYNHQIPRVMDECRPYLQEQFPELTTLNFYHVTEKNYDTWLCQVVECFGEHCEVEKMPEGAHMQINPLVELMTMMGDEKA